MTAPEHVKGGTSHVVLESFQPNSQSQKDSPVAMLGRDALTGRVECCMSAPEPNMRWLYQR